MSSHQVVKRIKDSEDEEIVALYLETHQDQYFSELYRRYSGKIFGKCLSFFKDEAASADAVHDIFIKILVSLGKFSERSKFSTWIYSITYNFCIDQIRKNKRFPISSIEIFGEEDNDIVDEEDEDWIDLLDMEDIEKVLDELNPQDKAVLLMKYMDDLPIKEICSILDKSESAIKMKLKRARERFQEIFNEKHKMFVYGK